MCVCVCVKESEGERWSQGVLGTLLAGWESARAKVANVGVVPEHPRN